ncbi:MAG: hypothetical protein ACI4RR_06705, partial [Eubacterium sp.]
MKYKLNRFGFILKTAVILLMIFLIIFTVCGCNNSVSDEIVYNQHSYTECDRSWHPYGNTVKQDDYCTYDNDDNNIFICETSLIGERIIYHRSDDTYPDTSQIDKISCIALTRGSEEITVDEKYKAQIVEMLNLQEKPYATEKIDYSSDFLFINVYYKDYPAYQNECAFCLSENGNVCIMFCETEKNSQKIGKE